MKSTKWKKGLCLATLTVFTTIGLGACGQVTEEDILANMKEYTSESGSVSICLDNTWTTQDLGNDTWLGAQSKSGGDEVVVSQLPKNQYNGSINSLEDLKALMEESFHVEDENSEDAPKIPGLSNLSAITCKLSTETGSGEGYIIYGESDYAYYMFVYSSKIISDNEKKKFDVSCGTLKETPIEEENNFSTEMTDTIHWFDATYAILTRLNNCNVKYFGGLAANAENGEAAKQGLEDSWGVTDRASADETMEWILSEGHRTDFKDTMQRLKDDGMQDAADRKAFIMENFEVTDEEAQYYVDMYSYYEQYGENAIDAWDYSRALYLAAFYYHAGYYTEQEALDKSLEIAKTFQPLFSSWDEAMASYLRGYEYWAQESSDERQAIYEELKAEENSLYNIDWNLAFEKTW